MKRLGHASRHRAQQGITLMVSMIFLVVLTLIVLSAIRVTNVNSKVAGNMQTQNEADASAQSAIEAVISDPSFTVNPKDSTSTVDINGSGSTGAAYTVAVPAPACIGKKPIKLSELDAANPDDVGCYASGAAQNTGIVGSGANGNSMCLNSNWDVNAKATAPTSTTPSAAIHQGVAVRVGVDAAC